MKYDLNELHRFIRKNEYGDPSLWGTPAYDYRDAIDEAKRILHGKYHYYGYYPTDEQIESGVLDALIARDNPAARDKRMSLDEVLRYPQK